MSSDVGSFGKTATSRTRRGKLIDDARDVPAEGPELRESERKPGRPKSSGRRDDGEIDLPDIVRIVRTGIGSLGSAPDGAMSVGISSAPASGRSGSFSFIIRPTVLTLSTSPARASVCAMRFFPIVGQSSLSRLTARRTKSGNRLAGSGDSRSDRSPPSSNLLVQSTTVAGPRSMRLAVSRFDHPLAVLSSRTLSRSTGPEAWSPSGWNPTHSEIFETQFFAEKRDLLIRGVQLGTKSIERRAFSREVTACADERRACERHDVKQRRLHTFRPILGNRNRWIVQEQPASHEMLVLRPDPATRRTNRRDSVRSYQIGERPQLRSSSREALSLESVEEVLDGHWWPLPS